MQEYKPPSSKDVPIDFRVKLLKDATNPVGVLGSKGMHSNYFAKVVFNGIVKQLLESQQHV